MVLPLAAVSLAGCQRPAPDPHVAAARHAFLAAVRALGAPDAPAMEVGEAWFLQRLARVCDDDALRTLVAQTEARLTGHRAARLLHADASPILLPADPGHGMRRFATYVFAAVGAPADRAIAFIEDFTATPDTGYVLTHQWLVLEWARAVGLAVPPALGERQDELLARIAAEQRVDDRFSDLFAERAAILLAAGRPPAADAARWIDVISTAQLANGRWESERTRLSYDGQSAVARHPWAHTTGFVAAATGFYLQQRNACATAVH